MSNFNFEGLEKYSWDEYLEDCIDEYNRDYDEEEIARHFWDDLEKC